MIENRKVPTATICIYILLKTRIVVWGTQEVD